MDLTNTQLFRGLEESEITTLLDCLNAAIFEKEKPSFPKGVLPKIWGSCCPVWL